MKEVFHPQNQHHQMNDSSNKKQTIVQHYADGTASVMRRRWYILNCGFTNVVMSYIN